MFSLLSIITIEQSTAYNAYKQHEFIMVIAFNEPNTFNVLALNTVCFINHAILFLSRFIALSSFLSNTKQFLF